MSVLDNDFEDQFEERVSFVSSIDSSLLVYRATWADDQDYSKDVLYKEVANVLSKFNILTEELVNSSTEHTHIFPILNPRYHGPKYQNAEEISVRVSLHIQYIGDIAVTARIVGLHEDDGIRWIVDRNYLMFEQEVYVTSEGIGCCKDKRFKDIVIHIKSRLEELLGKSIREYRDSTVLYYDLH